MAPARILVLGYRHLGDSLFLTPMLRALKRRFPAAGIDVVAGGAGAAALEGNPNVARVWPLRGRGTRPKLALTPALRRERYDVGVMAQHSLPNAIHLRLVGCRNTVGLEGYGCRPLLTHVVPVPRPCAAWHEVDRYLALAAALDAPGDDAGLEFHIPAADRTEAAATLDRLRMAGRVSGAGAGRTPLVAFFPGSSAEWTFKRWPADRFAALGRRLVAEGRAQVLVVGGRDDLPVMQEVSAAIGAPHAIDDTPGSLGRFAAIVSECDLLVTNDSGPMHLATAVGTRVVDLAGPSDPRRTGPYGNGHVVIQKVPPDKPRTWAESPDPSLPMKLITVDEVEAAVRTMLPQRP